MSRVFILSLLCVVNAFAATGPQLAHNIETNVSSTWQTVTLPNTYTSAVVLGTVVYAPTDVPTVVRIRNVGATSFELRVQNPVGEAALSGYSVHWLAIEEGVYTSGTDGATMEALRVDAALTGGRGNWGQVETVVPANVYTNPVVLGQVMTANDPLWSNFYAIGSANNAPPTASSIRVGKHVASDPTTARATETLGVVIVESGSGTVDTINFSAGLGADSVRGPDNSPPYAYSIPGPASAATAIVSTAGMDGNDGGWPVLWDTAPVGSSFINMAYDEDQGGDSERSHTTEQVAWMVLAPAAGGSNNDPVANDQTPAGGLEDQALVFTLDASDVDGDSLTYTPLTVPNAGTEGVITGTAPDLTFTPVADWNGSTSYSYQVDDGNGGSDTAVVTLTLAAVQDAPVADTQSVETTSDQAVVVTLTGSDADGEALTFAITQQPPGTEGSVSLDGNAATFTPAAGFTGVTTFDFVVNDGTENSPAATVTVTVNPSAPAASRLANGIETGVGSTWQTVALPDTYTSAVIIGTVVYNPGTVPVVVRIRNVGATSFDVRVQNPVDEAPLTGFAVHWLAIEEGVYASGSHGATMEAIRIDAPLTGAKNNWSQTEALEPVNTYINPVVFGQVMTANDPLWSNFYAIGASRSDPPTAGAINVGKHVAEDPTTVRLTETLGVLVIEAGSATVEGVQLAAGLGADTVAGVDNAPPYVYAIAGPASTQIAILSSAGMDGNDGGWPVMWDAAPVNATSINLVIDEDQGNGDERSHTSEQVAWLAMEPSSALPNTDPVANDQSPAGGLEDQDLVFTLDVTDADGDALAYTMLTEPDAATEGVVTGTAPDLTFTPVANWNGSTIYSYEVDDGRGGIDTAVVTLTLAAVQDAPVADAQSASTKMGDAVVITLTGSDVDGEALTYALTQQPPAAEGSVAVAGDAATFTPGAGFVGVTNFDFIANDGIENSSAATVTVTVNPNEVPTVSITNPTDDVTLVVGSTVSLVASAADADDAIESLTYAWSVLSGPSTPIITDDTLATAQVTLDAIGDYVLEVAVSDAATTVTEQVTVTARAPMPTVANLAHGVVTNASSTWQTIALPHSYTSAVVLGTPQYAVGTPPVVVRIRNVTATSFDLRVQNPINEAVLTDFSVHWLVVEEGVYSELEDGLTMEALRVEAPSTAAKGDWDHTVALTPANTYVKPAVIGQVMTENNTEWSQFFAVGTARNQAPSPSAINVGKHVGADPLKTRVAETLGVLIIESGTGTLEGNALAADTGADSIRGVDNAPPFTYAITAPAASSTALASSAGLDVNDGGWPILWGATPVGPSFINLAIDEDQGTDAERGHGTEQVAWLVLDPFAAPNQAPVVTPGQTILVNEDEVWTGVLTATDADGDSITFSIETNASNGVVEVVDADAGEFSYTPDLNYYGADSFTVIANDGTVDSAIETIAVTVTPVIDVTFDPLNAAASAVFTEGNQHVTIPGPGIARSTVSGDAVGNYYAEFEYIQDGFMYVGIVTESHSLSKVVGQNPSGYGFSLNNGEKRHSGIDSAYGAAAALNDIIGVYVSGGNVEFFINGVSQGIAFEGVTGDYYFAVSSGSNDDSVARARYDSSQWQYAPAGAWALGEGLPVAVDKEIVVAAEMPGSVLLESANSDGPVTFEVTVLPQHGSLSGTAPDLTYTSNPGFIGVDTFSYTVSDDKGVSLPGVIELTVYGPGLVVFDPVVKAPTAVLTEANRHAAISDLGYARTTASVVARGDYYVEFEVTNNQALYVGIARPTYGPTNWLGFSSESYGFEAVTGNIRFEGGATGYGAACANGDVLGVRLHDGQLEYSINGVSQGIAANGLVGEWHFAISSGGVNDTSSARGRFDAASMQYLPTGSVAVTDVSPSPVADAGQSFATEVGVVATLDGTASYDPDNAPAAITYQWQQVYGASVVLSDVTAAQPTFTAASEGVLVFELVVSDAQLESVPAQVRVDITEDGLPYARVAFDPDYTKSSFELSEANRLVTMTPDGTSLSTHPMNATGEYYAEIEMVQKAGQPYVGISTRATNIELPFAQDNQGYAYLSDTGEFRHNNVDTAYGAAYSTGDVIGIYVHQGNLEFLKNGVSQGIAATGLTGDWYYAVASPNIGQTAIARGRFSPEEMEYLPNTASVIIPDPEVDAGVSSLDSPLVASRGYDHAEFLADPDAYVNKHAPGRIWEVAVPGVGVPVLTATGSRYLRVTATYVDPDESETLVPLVEVQTAPNAPVTFYASEFNSSYATDSALVQTVQADESGLATLNSAINQHHVGRHVIVAGSPMASGQVRWVVQVDAPPE